MKRGRPTKDPKLAILQGKKPSAAAKAAAAAPKKAPAALPVKAPKMPADLPRKAKEHWQEIVPLLLQMGTVTEADRGKLVMMCNAWYRWHQYEELIDEHGAMFVGEKGLQTNPAVEMARRMEQRYSDLAKSFGMDPLARTKIEIMPAATAEQEAAKNEPPPHQVPIHLLSR